MKSLLHDSNDRGGAQGSVQNAFAWFKYKDLAQLYSIQQQKLAQKYLALNYHITD